MRILPLDTKQKEDSTLTVVELIDTLICQVLDLCGIQHVFSMIMQTETTLDLSKTKILIPAASYGALQDFTLRDGFYRHSRSKLRGNTRTLIIVIVCIIGK